MLSRAVVVYTDNNIVICDIKDYNDIKNLLGGWLEVVLVGSDFILYVDEDGISKCLPRNDIATKLTAEMLAVQGREFAYHDDDIKGTAIFIGQKHVPDEGLVCCDIPDRVIQEYFGRYLNCKRMACQATGAICQHSQTGDLYCVDCAIKINKANPESPNLIRIPELS